MLKPLTLSLSLAFALGASSVSMAGGLFGHDSGCTTCGLASPQGVVTPSAQYAPVASAQCETPCETPCAPAKSCGLKNLFSGLHKPKVYTYEWVLKKKRVWGHKNPCSAPSCDTCTTPTVFPSSQGYASPQGYSSPQAYAAPTYGSGQAYSAPQATSVTAPAPAPAGDEAPPAPEAPAPAAPAPAAPAANAPQSSLLFSTPAGN